jgi:hypothetical protein
VTEEPLRAALLVLPFPLSGDTTACPVAILLPPENLHRGEKVSNRNALGQSTLTPSNLERLRTRLARLIFLEFTLGLRLAKWIAPPSHPWTTLIESAYDDLREVTHAALRPRTPSGIRAAVDTLEEHDGKRRVRWGWGRRMVIVVTALSTGLLFASTWSPAIDEHLEQTAKAQGTGYPVGKVGDRWWFDAPLDRSERNRAAQKHRAAPPA